MRIPRLFFPNSLELKKTFALPENTAHYVFNVLRLKAGDEIIVFNGSGGEYFSEIYTITKRQVSFIPQSFIEKNIESPITIHLGQGVSKGDRMEFSIQKAIELGVSEITPVITARCNVKLSNERWQKKIQHWQQIAISACEQCGREKVPKINIAQSLAQWLTQHTELTRIVLDPTAKKSAQHIPNTGKFSLLIGPEGGLTTTEIEQSVAVGYQAIHLGPRILRTETSALSAITALQLLFGDLS